MSATIYIPTYRRVDNQTTWRFISPEWKERTFLVARPDEVESLDILGYPVLPMPDGVEEGISPTRQWILDQHNVPDLGPNLIMMDDDLYFYRRRGDDPTKFHSHLNWTPEDWNEMMGQFLGLMEESPIVGIRNRSGANRYVEPKYLENVRLHDVLGLDMRVVREHGFRIDRVRFMQDFDITLQFLTRGYKSLCLNTFCKGDRGSNTPGGCSEFRDLESHAEAARKLQSLYPWCVRLTERPGWNGSMSGTRTDVAIQWKKAYEAGLKIREADLL